MIWTVVVFSSEPASGNVELVGALLLPATAAPLIAPSLPLVAACLGASSFLLFTAFAAPAPSTASLFLFAIVACSKVFGKCLEALPKFFLAGSQILPTARYPFRRLAPDLSRVVGAVRKRLASLTTPGAQVNIIIRVLPTRISSTNAPRNPHNSSHWRHSWITDVGHHNPALICPSAASEMQQYAKGRKACRE